MGVPSAASLLAQKVMQQYGGIPSFLVPNESPVAAQPEHRRREHPRIGANLAGAAAAEEEEVTAAISRLPQLPGRITSPATALRRESLPPPPPQPQPQPPP